MPISGVIRRHEDNSLPRIIHRAGESMLCTCNEPPRGSGPDGGEYQAQVARFFGRMREAQRCGRAPGGEYSAGVFGSRPPRIRA